MDVRIDHVVIWVADPLRALAFYEEVVGLPGVRVDEFRNQLAPFPSVRVSEDSIIDLMPLAAAATVDQTFGTQNTAGHVVNHVCFAMSRDEFAALRQRLADHAVMVSGMREQSFGARGLAPQTLYFLDPDSNVIEARYYETPGA